MMSFIDPHGRKIDYLRLSLTEHCNLRCFYCMPAESKCTAHSSSQLTFDEIERVVAAFAALGVYRLRLTGGEPLLRKGVAELAARLNAVPGIEDLSMSTNAMLLAHHGAALRNAGVSRLNISLDSLNPDRFARITHGARLEDVFAGLEAAKHAGFSPIKINMLVMKGINDDEVVDMAHYCLDQGFTLRYIETMPMGAGGQQAFSHYLPLDVVKDRLAAQFQLVEDIASGGGPARYLRIPGSKTQIGFITPLSRHFCATCNRVRLGADGTLYMCLGNTHSVALKPHLRQGISESGLVEVIQNALAIKPLRHNFEQQAGQINRAMSATGG
ncbi:GTP 3',8-cyclase MoaA [Pseudovibrio exalbescens]|uniref:GTP 3',8-cyclase n=2 Tax=Pseudovibrio exalbescens TaxID=197461 RepID=A0A1U7JGI3_9HYPH|nr:GTP 3',8-cyclase MoaA [Pseudovibrio exalbescens]OKL43853.1 cyclic pyranopterin phosphate synthase MoaA [Pseudovibrio exalbescens]